MVIIHSRLKNLLDYQKKNSAQKGQNFNFSRTSIFNHIFSFLASQVITAVGNAMLNVGLVEQFRRLVHDTMRDDFLLDHSVTEYQHHVFVNSFFSKISFFKRDNLQMFRFQRDPSLSNSQAYHTKKLNA